MLARRRRLFPTDIIEGVHLDQFPGPNKGLHGDTSPASPSQLTPPPITMILLVELWAGARSARMRAVECRRGIQDTLAGVELTIFVDPGPDSLGLHIVERIVIIRAF